MTSEDTSITQELKDTTTTTLPLNRPITSKKAFTTPELKDTTTTKALNRPPSKKAYKITILGLFVAIIVSSIGAIFKQHKAAFFFSSPQIYFDAPSLIKSTDDDPTSSSSFAKNHEDASENENTASQPRKMNSNSDTSTTTLKKKGPLNILLLYADDWRHDSLGSAGNAVLKTPVLDQLAADGVRFTENCVTTSICWISRATLYSGMYLARHKFEMLGRGRTVNGTEMGYEPPKNETIYALLKHKARYHVGHAGKLGLWLDIDQHKHFDYFVDEDGWHYRDVGGGKGVMHITEKNTMDAMEFLDKRPRDKPFFLNVAYFATHAVDGDPKQYMPQNRTMDMYEDDVVPVPKTATEEAWKKMPYFFGEFNEGRTRWGWRFDTPKKHQTMMKNYYRMASEVDTSVGVLLDKLREQGVLDNTMIIFTTDNGNFHAEHGLADKWYPHQESIRVPLIIKDPRMSKDNVGTTNDDFTLNIDLAPTILGAAGLDPLPSMMGRDMSTLYRDHNHDDTTMAATITTTTNTTTNITTTRSKSRAYLPPARDGHKEEYHTGTHSSWRTEFFYEHPMHSNREFIPASEALVRKDYKYFYWPNFRYEQLFDLKKDPGEMNDLFSSKEHHTKLQQMRKRFKHLKKLAHSKHAMIF